MNPDSRAERDGPQTGPGQYARWNTTAPRRAKASRCGVFAWREPPKAPTQSLRSSSAMKRTFFGVAAAPDADAARSAGAMAAASTRRSKVRRAREDMEKTGVRVRLEACVREGKAGSRKKETANGLSPKVKAWSCSFG